MKVNLDAHMISVSMADALEHYGMEVHLPQFSECADTVRVLRSFDGAFDLLNSRNSSGSGFNARYA